MMITFRNSSGAILEDDIARVCRFVFVVGALVLVVFLWNSGSVRIDYCKGWMDVASSRHLIRCELDFQYFASRKIDWNRKKMVIDALGLDFVELKIFVKKIDQNCLF